MNGRLFANRARVAPLVLILAAGCASREEQLFQACIEGNTDRIGRLLDKGADVNTRSPFGETPLMSFISLNANRGENQATEFAETVDRMIDAGADVAATNDVGITALHLAAGMGRGHRRVVQRLLEAGADPNAVSTLNRSTPLHSAAFPTPLTEHQQRDWTSDERAEHYDVLRLLIEAGADPTLRDLRGRAPLDTAQESGSREIAEILFKGQ